MAWSMIMLTVSECVCVYTVDVYLCVCCAPLFNARQDGWEQRNIACHCWMTEPFQPPSPPLPPNWMQRSNHRWQSPLCDGGRGCYSGPDQWAVGVLVFSFACFHPGSGICQLRTNGGISWGKSWLRAWQHCYQQQGWLSFRGHTQDSACMHNNME